MKLTILLIFSFCLLIGCSKTNPVDPEFVSNIPEGAIHIEYWCERPEVPDSFTVAMIWFDAATLKADQPTSEEAIIIIDYMKWIEKDLVTGVETVLGVQEYNHVNPRPLTTDEGNLYQRLPTWFGGNNFNEPMNASLIQNGELTLRIKEHPDRVFLWWTPRFNVQLNKNYGVELRVKVVGKTSIQCGMDWWRSMDAQYEGPNVNNRFSFAGDWLGDTNGEYIVLKEFMLR